MTYFILVNNQQQGPFTIDELRARAITSDTLVWTEGMAQWTPAWQVEELKPLFFGSQTGTANSGTATPPPPPIMDSGVTPVPEDGRNNVQSPAPKPRRKKSHKSLWITLIVLVIVLFILALTNPGKAEHRQAILSKIDTATGQVDNISDPMARTIVRTIMGAGNGMITEVVKELVDNDLEYHNYIFFSTTTLHSDLLEHDVRTSTGFLGKVNAISLSNLVPDIITRQIGIGSDGGDNQGNTQEEESTTQTTQDENGNETTTTSKVLRKNGITIDSLTKKVTNRIADEVAGQVKKEVRQQTDSTTASGIDAIVNDVLNFIKGL